MKKYILFFSLISLLAWSCEKDEGNLSPSGLEKNWFVLEDSDDPIDHLRYEIFRSTGIPIYYNDTIGSEQRNSPGIGEYTYYEVLQVFYSPGSTTPSPLVANYTLHQDKNTLESLLVFLRDEVIPEIPAGTYLPSILIVDTLNTSTGDSLAYKGLNTTVVGQAHRFDEMPENEKALLKGNFLASSISNVLLLNEAEWLEENFYALTYDLNPDNKDYLYNTETSMYAVYRAFAYWPTTNIPPKVEAYQQTLGLLGFIGPKSKPRAGLAERNWYVPTKEQDVQQYCQAILAYSEEEFMELYGSKIVQRPDDTTTPDIDESGEELLDFPTVRAKYYVMKAKLQEYGFTFEH